jgi:hypothetical protein
VEYEIRAVSSSLITEFTDVDCGDNIDLAMRLVEGIFQEVFPARELRFRVRTNDICPRDELIDYKTALGVWARPPTP